MSDQVMLQLPDDQKAIESARLIAQAELGEVESFNSEDERLAYNATLDLIMAKVLAGWVKRSWATLRKHVFDVFISGSWCIVPVPVKDATGRTTGEYRRYIRFDDWFDEVVSGLNSTYRSTLWNNTTVLLPAVANHSVTTADGEIITTDQLFNMPESQWEILAGVANPVARRANAGDEEALGELSGLIGDALTLSRRRLQAKWREEGFIGGAAPVNGYQVIMDNGSIAYIILPTNEAETKRIGLALTGQTNLETVDENEVTELLQGVFHNANQPVDFEAYLQSPRF